MEFFDCNVSYGLDVASSALYPVTNVEQLDGEIRKAGVAKAVVWRIEQLGGSPLSANRLVADDIRGREHLYGTWAIVPTHTHELPDPDKMPAIMKANRIIGWRLFPSKCRFFPRAFVLREWLEVAVARKIPIFISTAHGTRLEDLQDILEHYPELRVVLTYAHDWPSDRFFRPFVKEFPNLYVDWTFSITDGGIESFVEEYGSSRLLYGSGFPRCYFGGNMLMVRHAQVPEADRAAIAGGNMSRLVAEVQLD
jgi:predicted TIM-barrel fold metal-dependent hydrolase